MITGDWAAGKTSLALSPLIRVSKERHPTAIIDVAGCLFPPVIARMGADLERVLLVRPRPRKAVWATEQILRSGIFHAVLLIDSVLSRDRNGLKLSGAMLRKLQLASEVANALMLVVHSRRVDSGGSSLCIKVEASPAKEQPDEVGFTATSRLAQVSVLRGARAGSALVEL